MGLLLYFSCIEMLFRLALSNLSPRNLPAVNFFISCQLDVIISMPVSAEHDIIPGRAVPPECHPEVHTDYAGAAVRWGLSHHVGSAADCCQACLDQAKTATEPQKKCNIWVYCPNEGGCYSPDKYTHKVHECWLKQVSYYCSKNSFIYYSTNAVCLILSIALSSCC